MSLLDHFKPWKLVAEMEVTVNWSGGLLFPDRKWTEKNLVAFFEKTPDIRKIKIVGNNSSELKKCVEKMVYKWRDHKGELPNDATTIN